MEVSMPALKNRHILLLFLLLSLLYGLTFATVLGDLAASMQAGDWKELSTQGYVVSGTPILAVNGSSGGGSMTEYSDKGVWNPITKEVWFYGGSHCGSGCGCPGSDKIIRYSLSTNTWSTIANSGQGCGHTYEQDAIDPATGIFYNRSYSGSTINQFTTQAGAWSTLTTIPANVWRPQSTCCAALEYSPEMKGLVIVGGGQPFGGGGAIGFYSLVSNQWRQLASNLTMGAYSNICGYSSANHLVYFGGGSPDFYKMDSSGLITKLANAPITVSTSTTSVGTTDPVTGDYLVIGNSGGFYAFSFTANAWRLISNNPPAYAAGQGSQVQIFCSPVPDAGVVMFGTYNFANSKVYIYKHAAGGASGEKNALLPFVSDQGIGVSPNPFSAKTCITVAANFEIYSAQVFDPAGKLVQTLAWPRGKSWNSMAWDAGHLPSGVYLISLHGGDRMIRKYVTLLK